MSFNVGDRVRVVKLGFGINAPGYIGKEFIVSRIDIAQWVKLEGDHRGFNWHPSLLELVVEDDIIRVGDLVEPIPVEELPSILKSLGNINMQKVLLSKGVWPKVVEEITTAGDNPRIYLEGGAREWHDGLYLTRFRKVRTNDPNRKYIKVITKIREIKKRRESLGYKY